MLRIEGCTEQGFEKCLAYEYESMHGCVAVNKGDHGPTYIIDLEKIPKECKVLTIKVQNP